MKGLKNRYKGNVLITGASSGIGKEFAVEFAKLGYNLILIARRKYLLDSLCAELRENYNVESLAFECDLSNPKFIESLKNELSGKEIGVLINNAGVGSTGYFFNSDIEKDSKMIFLNCLAPFLLTRFVLDQMIERKNGAIIFLGSIVSFNPTPLMACYSATKAFNRFIGEALWKELKDFNIDVLTLNPGGTITEFQRIANITGGPFAAKPNDVVITALKALGRKSSVIHGLINNIAILISRFLPFRLLMSIIKKIFCKLYK